ncbi:MAG TPA: BON domain-containing protein [Blastocatellia bacterium]
MKTEYQYMVAKLQGALAKDPRVNVLDIKVLVTGERIHMTGQVGSEEGRAAATEIASAILPGADVRNEITILEIGAPGLPEAIVD